MRQPNDQDLPAVITAIRNTIESLLADNPEGHRAVTCAPRIPYLVDDPPLGFDVWEIDAPLEAEGERVRLLARLVTDDHLICVYGFDERGINRSQAVFGSPASRADLIVSAVISECDRGLVE